MLLIWINDIKLENTLPSWNWIWNKKTLKVHKYWESNLPWAREETSTKKKKKFREQHIVCFTFIFFNISREKRTGDHSHVLSDVFALLQHHLFRCLCMHAYQAQKTTTLVASGVEGWARKILFFPGLPWWWYLPGTGWVNWSKSCLRALLSSLKCCTQFIMPNLDGFGLKFHVVIFLPSYLRVPWPNTQRD